MMSDLESLKEQRQTFEADRDYAQQKVDRLTLRIRYIQDVLGSIDLPEKV